MCVLCFKDKCVIICGAWWERYLNVLFIWCIILELGYFVD